MQISSSPQPLVTMEISMIHLELVSEFKGRVPEKIIPALNENHKFKRVPKLSILLIHWVYLFKCSNSLILYIYHYSLLQDYKSGRPTKW
jgi:hypothetical protein